MSVEPNTIKIMVSMSPAVHEQLKHLSENLGASKSKIVQLAIISMQDAWKNASEPTKMTARCMENGGENVVD